MTYRVGLIVNPIAGMGGRVGLKGTDGHDALQTARALGATPLSGERARQALAVLQERLGENLVIVAPAGPMGGDIAISLGIDTHVLSGVHSTSEGAAPVDRGELSTDAPEDRASDTRAVMTGSGTTAADTRDAVAAMLSQRIDLLLFAGGDGTARDVCEAAGNGPPALGIPTGVKMHSAVYATTPRAAGEAAAAFLTAAQPRLRESEVMDIDEEAFRQGRLSARLYGYLQVPAQRGLVQSLKSGSTSGEGDLSGLASDIAERMRDGALWIMAPGTTTRAIAARLGIEKTLLGVDLVSRREMVVADATEQTILRHLDGVPARIVVTPIGGQGYLFGRGNQQISPEVIRRVGRENIVVVATPAKLAGLAGAPLLVDTGDAELDAELAGYIRVVTGYRQESVQRVA